MVVHPPPPEAPVRIPGCETSGAAGVAGHRGGCVWLIWQSEEAPPTTRPSHHAASCTTQQLVGKQSIPHTHHCFASPLLLSMNVFARHLSQGDNDGTCFQSVTSIAFFCPHPRRLPYEQGGQRELPELPLYGDQGDQSPWDSDTAKSLAELASPQPPMLTPPYPHRPHQHPPQHHPTLLTLKSPITTLPETPRRKSSQSNTKPPPSARQPTPSPRGLSSGWRTTYQP